ncbi:MAG: TOBE domain-containing protein [Chitinophagaceae bacterium]|nr:MAG: TOBE domain-containing protein [Chitinophagaceae bacterium]
MKKVIDDLSNELKISCILVSHDPIDTLSWADQILVLEKGNLIQKDEPQAVYFHPANEYAASLFGTYNKLSSFLAQTFQQSAVSQPSFVRPQMFQLTSPENGIEATITRINFMGGYNQVEVEAHGDKIILNTMEPLLNLGDTVYIRLETKKPSEI